MQNRTAAAVFEYGGRDRVVGDTFEVEDAHVPIMLAMGHIEPMEGEPGFIAPAKAARSQRVKAQAN